MREQKSSLCIEIPTWFFSNFTSVPITIAIAASYLVAIEVFIVLPHGEHNAVSRWKWLSIMEIKVEMARRKKVWRKGGNGMEWLENKMQCNGMWKHNNAYQERIEISTDRHVWLGSVGSTWLNQIKKWKLLTFANCSRNRGNCS